LSNDCIYDLAMIVCFDVITYIFIVEFPFSHQKIILTK